TLEDAYTAALLREIEAAGLGPRASVESIYFGGGTPSRMTLENLTRIVRGVRGPRPEARGLEFSMECNPEDITAESLSACRERGRAVLPDDEVIAQMYVDGIDRLARAGFHQYEISNFAKAGEECRHNLRYWTRGEYLGLGLGAHSFIGGVRFANTRDIHRYIT